LKDKAYFLGRRQPIEKGFVNNPLVKRFEAYNPSRSNIGQRNIYAKGRSGINNFHDEKKIL
jgi:hypothetical protein